MRKANVLRAVARARQVKLLMYGVVLMTISAYCQELTTTGQTQKRNQWVKEHLLDPSPRIPFSFVYDGQASEKLLAAWTRTDETRTLDTARTQYIFVWTDPKTGLEVRCVAVEYADYPGIEWTAYFKNTGTNNTPVLETIQGLDAWFERSANSEFVLHGIKGDSCTPDSYQPYDLTLSPNARHRFAPVGGRPTNGEFPYYNLQAPDGGVLLAVGWPGQWAASFTRDASNGLRIVAGQELTRLVLRPCETVRTPLIALLFWEGRDTVRSQNLWRRWFMAHNIPRIYGRPPAPIYVFCSGGLFPGLKVSEASERQFIDVLTREGVKIDYWWMDAGWYACNAWPEVGTWEYDRDRFPSGIRAVSDYAHGKGMKLILWFEPERVTAGSWIAANHPDWVLGGSLLNLGNPAARAWLTEHVDALIAGQGIDLYRQDFNMDPLACWRGNDSPDRQGMTENLHVQGYLAYWDELRRRHPGMLIDSCASGGRRNDLETLRRAVPLLRSDYQAFDGNPGYAPGNQGHTYGLSAWLPYYGHGVYQSRENLDYYVRSHMSPSFGICVDVRESDIDWDHYRRLVMQWRRAADCMLGDYYPLTPYSLQLDQWIAWQFDRPEQGNGLIQAFRRDYNGEARLTFRLSGLDPAAQYQITNLDLEGSTRVSGKNLMEKGLTVEIKDKPGSAVIVYKKVD